MSAAKLAAEVVLGGAYDDADDLVRGLRAAGIERRETDPVASYFLMEAATHIESEHDVAVTLAKAIA